MESDIIFPPEIQEESESQRYEEHYPATATQ